MRIDRARRSYGLWAMDWAISSRLRSRRLGCRPGTLLSQVRGIAQVPLCLCACCPPLIVAFLAILESWYLNCAIRAGNASDISVCDFGTFLLPSSCSLPSFFFSSLPSPPSTRQSWSQLCGKPRRPKPRRLDLTRFRVTPAVTFPPREQGFDFDEFGR